MVVVTVLAVVCIPKSNSEPNGIIALLGIRKGRMQPEMLLVVSQDLSGFRIDNELSMLVVMLDEQCSHFAFQRHGLSSGRLYIGVADHRDSPLGVCSIASSKGRT